jgi:hypothetical protein
MDSNQPHAGLKCSSPSLVWGWRCIGYLSISNAPVLSVPNITSHSYTAPCAPSSPTRPTRFPTNYSPSTWCGPMSVSATTILCLTGHDVDLGKACRTQVQTSTVVT